MNFIKLYSETFKKCKEDVRNKQKKIYLLEKEIARLKKYHSVNAWGLCHEIEELKREIEDRKDSENKTCAWLQQALERLENKYNDYTISHQEKA